MQHGLVHSALSGLYKYGVRTTHGNGLNQSVLISTPAHRHLASPRLAAKRGVGVFLPVKKKKINNNKIIIKVSCSHGIIRLNYAFIKFRLKFYQPKLSPRENHCPSLNSTTSTIPGPLGGLWVQGAWQRPRPSVSSWKNGRLHRTRAALLSMALGRALAPRPGLARRRITTDSTHGEPCGWCTPT